MAQASEAEALDLTGGADGLRRGHRWPGTGPRRRDPARTGKGGGGGSCKRTAVQHKSDRGREKWRKEKKGTGLAGEEVGDAMQEAAWFGEAEESRRNLGRLVSFWNERMQGLQEREALAREELEARRTSAAREVDRRADLERSGLRGDFFGSGGSR